MAAQTPTPVRVALDWTPNTIHSGLFLARARNLYAAAGLDVQLLAPDAAYSQTPAKRLELGHAELAVCPSESCVAYAESGKMGLQAVYAILQRDASAVVSTKLGRVGELGQGVYGSYNARYEDGIVRAMVAGDGGNGEGVRIERQKGKLGLFEAVRRGEVDATWVFLPWEGVEAELDGVGFKAFRPEESGVPYGYSPVIARNAGSSALSEEALKKFVEATREGYELAIRDVGAAVECLGPFCEPKRSEEFLRKSQASINQFYSDGVALGTMSEEKWKAWIKWLEGQGLLKAGSVDASKLYTNTFHP